MYDGIGWLIIGLFGIFIAFYSLVIKPYRKARQKCRICGIKVGKYNVVYDAENKDWYHYRCHLEMKKSEIFGK